MSALAIGSPGTLFVSIARPFKPFAASLMRAASSVLISRQSAEQRARRNNERGVLMLNRMAIELDSTQPNLAAELRLLACRG